MRNRFFNKLMATLAAIALVLWLAGPTQAESGCHKVKGKGAAVKAIEVIE